WGFYTVDVEWRLPARPARVERAARYTLEGRHSAATARHKGTPYAQASDSLTFRVQTPGEWTFRAVHEPRESGAGHSSVNWQISWGLGSVWWPLGGVAILLALGALSLICYSVTRNMGVARLEARFEEARAQLALDLRQRHTQRRSDASARWVEGATR
ncbi:MAG: hypothetical protein AB8H79_05360, partial [Myxococcota bacterium]